MNPKLRAPLCDVCKAMLATLAGHIESLPTPEGQRRICEGPHHKSTKSLLMSAAWGCGICVRLDEHLRRGEFRAKYSRETTDRPWLKYKFVIHTDFNSFSLEFLDWQGVSHLGSFSGLQLETWMTGQNDPRNLSSDNTGDKDVIERAHSWLSDCILQHQSCKKHDRTDYYPPRLLHLDEDSVRLIETNNTKISGPYATLSYCWGRNPRHLTLTTNNIGAFRGGFKASHLAKTFREAIQVAQLLGLHLLWIDALCILQSGDGHVEDWQNHLVEMAVIYANCVLNIAVDHGESAEAGCFVSRDGDSIRPCIFDISLLAQRTMNTFPEQEQPHHLDMHHVIDKRFWSDLLSENPLIGRGWVHQERLLSPRILHFGKKQLAWECKSLLACETFPAGQKSIIPGGRIPFSFNGSTSGRWYKVIEAYSAASLTNLQDKLPAIAGIAKRVAIERSAKYAAGMFLSDFPESLLWYYNDGPLGSVVTPYRAPSWSWASREGKVSFHRITGQYSEGGTFARIDDIVLEYTDDNNPFGQLKSAFMRITAPVARIAWTDSVNDTRILVNDIKLNPLNSSNSMHEFSSFSGMFSFDESTLVRPRLETSFLFLMYTDTSLHGLILAPIDKSAQPQRWMRIGVFSLDLGYWKNRKRQVADEIPYLEKYLDVTIELV